MSTLNRKQAEKDREQDKKIIGLERAFAIMAEEHNKLVDAHNALVATISTK